MSGGQGEKKALAYALKLLGYRQRSRKELGFRLHQKGFSRLESDSVLERLEAQGYIDDASTARALRDHAERVKLLGHSGARSFLRQRGIGAAHADLALEDYDEQSAALKLLERKRKALAGLPRHVARRRLAGYLGRRGYSGEMLYRILRLALDETDGGGN